MNAIIGFTALAAAHVNQPDQVQEYLNKISTSGQHLFRLNQILLNLLSNATKFTQNGSTIIVRIIQKPYYKKGYALYEFHVRANGIGISREFQEHLFESFTREETSTVSGIQGTGLGMAINVAIWYRKSRWSSFRTPDFPSALQTTAMLPLRRSAPQRRISSIWC